MPGPMFIAELLQNLSFSLLLAAAASIKFFALLAYREFYRCLMTTVGLS